MTTILAAEDDPGLRLVLGEVLGMVDGWAVATFPDGAKLLEALSTAPPSLIVLDVMMPGIGGIQTYSLLRERDGMKDVPVLFVTAKPGKVAAAKLAGPHDHLAKPFDIDALVAKPAAAMGVPAPEM